MNYESFIKNKKIIKIDTISKKLVKVDLISSFCWTELIYKIIKLLFFTFTSKGGIESSFEFCFSFNLSLIDYFQKLHFELFRNFLKSKLKFNFNQVCASAKAFSAALLVVDKYKYLLSYE